MRFVALVVVLVGAGLAGCGDNISVTVPDGTPTVESLSVTTREDTPVTVTVNATDPDGEVLTLTFTPATHGTVTAEGVTLTYAPEGNYQGPDAVQVTVSDGTATATATISITVTPANDAPVAVADTLAASEDTAATITVSALLANDTDADGDVLSVFAVGSASSGTVALAADVVTFTPATNFTGTATFEYSVTDGTYSDTGQVTVTVGGGNDPPVAVDDALSTGEDTALALAATTLTGNDSDPEGQSLSVTAVGNPSTGTVALDAGTITFTPGSNFTGAATFDYTLSDGAATDTGQVTVTVTPVNDAPIALAGAAMTNEDTAVTITLTGSDIEGSSLTFSVIAADTLNGTLGAIAQVTSTTASITYTPNANSSADDVIVFQVSDGTLTSATAIVTIDVVPVDDAPLAIAGAVMTNEDTAITITLAGADPEGTPLTFAIVTGPATGTLGAVTQETSTTATVTYTPGLNATADDAFTFRVNDGAGSAPATIAIDVVPVNDAPVATAGSATTDEDTAVTITLAGSDAEGSTLSFAIVTPPTSGTLGAIATASATTATVTYTPNANSGADDSFTFRVNDGTSDSVPAAVTIDVVPVNDAPVAVDDTDSVERDTALVRASSVYAANDTDLDGPAPLTIIAIENAVNGTVTLIAGTITFTPNANFVGAASFDYVVSDGGLAVDTGRVSVTVLATNTPPIAVDDVATSPEDTLLPITAAAFASNDTDPDPQPLTIVSAQNPVNGTIVDVGGVPQFSPTPNYSGPASFEYVVSDGLATDVGLVAVTVTPVNDAPIAQGQTLTRPENAPTTIVLAASDVDLPAQTLTFAIAIAPTHGVLGALTPTSATTASVVYTPTANYVGPDFFTFTAGDGVATSAQTTISITVTNVVVCNDGVVEAPESCDDQGNADGDGCSAVCQTESGWSCTGAPSACEPICNDGIVIAGEEECDDNNAVDTDGCTTLCQAGPICAIANASLAAGDRFATDPATGTCYVSFDDEMSTFGAAQTACIASGGHLATITSSGEQTLVASVQNPAQNPWIGGTDALVEGSFGWITGEAFAFSGFATGQPDGGDPEDCLNLFSTTAGPAGETARWNDTNCDFVGFTAGRICELPADVCGDGFLQPSRNEQCDDGNTTAGDGCSATCHPEVVFSEYVEGSSDNKALEIANPFTTSKPLTGCSLRLFFNGNPTSTASIPLTQTIAANDVLVVCHSSSDASLLAQCDVPTGSLSFNGNDAVDLICGGAIIDSIGQVGFDPGTEWGTGLTSTADNTIRRKCSVTQGDTVNNDVFAPALQWGGFDVDTFADLGTYTCVP